MTAPGGPGGSGAGGGPNGSGAGGAAPAVDPVCAVRQCFTVTSLADVVAARGPITLADIAHFRPVPGVDHMEPNGWMVVGLDTNFYATGGPQVVDGELLGFPASVRFTPIGWTWRYGDGASTTRGIPGGTWAALGVEEFDATPTSHIYRAAGTYFIDLDIRYRAEYRFAGLGWTAITGTITLPANRLVATAGDAKTVLVNEECTRNPSGPGC